MIFGAAKGKDNAKYYLQRRDVMALHTWDSMTPSQLDHIIGFMRGFSETLAW